MALKARIRASTGVERLGGHTPKARNRQHRGEQDRSQRKCEPAHHHKNATHCLTPESGM